jgi:circadian clock protein KaiC
MTSADERLSTGVDGLDRILRGGLIGQRGYMLRGPPGAGKTILAFHFLAAGAAAGETSLFVNLEEDLDDLRENAERLGFDTDRIDFLDRSPGATVFTQDDSYDVFTAAEVEQEPLTEDIVERVRELEPDRVVVDPLTQLRYLASGEYQFRKQVVGFMRFLKSVGATVLFTTQETDQLPTDELQFISDGTVAIESTEAGRRIAVPKFRGSGAESGDHAVRITGEGVRVYPELRPGDHGRTFTEESVSAGVDGVDDLLNGGIERGRTTILSGTTGVGKTTLATQFAAAAAGRGERAVVYLFEEDRRTFLTRSEGIGIPVQDRIDDGTLRVEAVEALERSPQEFAHRVRREVEEEDARFVVLDGVAGYRLTLRGEDHRLVRRLHALRRYLNNMGVVTVLVDETDDVVGGFQPTSHNISYLADNIVFLRHLELEGELRKAIGVLKKRTSEFERTLRQYSITEDGITVGEPLTHLRGIMTGQPRSVGED